MKDQRRKKFKVDADDYQGLDIFRLKLKNEINFEKQKGQGIIVIRINGFNLENKDANVQMLTGQKPGLRD